MGAKMLKKFKKFIKKNILFKIQNEELWQLNKDYKQFKKLKKEYGQLIKADSILQPDAVAPKKIWFCWLQGIENAPMLVKSCYESLKKHLVDYEIIVITADNLNNYIELPDYIINKWKRGIISNTHFSDVLRLSLLAKWGGTWIDSTVLCTGVMPKYIEDSDFFVFSNEFRNDKSIRLSSWFIHSVANHQIISQTRELLYKYWEKENKLCHYFLMHMFMTMVMNENEDLLIDMPFISNINPHTLQFKYLFKTQNAKDIELVKSLSTFHKLSYKFDKEHTSKENTNYQLIIKGDF